MTKKSKNSKTFKIAQVALVVALVILGFSIGTRVKNPFLYIEKFLSGNKNLSAASLSVKELKKELENKDFVFINVHTPYEGEIGKTDSFIEYDSLLASKNLLPKDLNARIVLYCKS